MDKFDRIFQLHSILKNRKRAISGADLMRQLECSKATLHRSLDLLRDVLRAPVVFDADSGGYCYAKDTAREAYELPGLWFSADELQALTLIHRLVLDAGGGLLEDQLKPLAERLKALIGHSRLNLGEVKSRLRFPNLSGRPAGDAFHACLSATLQRRQLEFRYHARGTDEVSARLVSPQRVVHYRESWYLDAWDEAKSGLRSFAIDRIRNAVVTSSATIDLSEAALDAHFASSFGIFGGEPNKVAVLHFTAERARWVADEPWHPNKEARYLDDGRYELKIPYRDHRELVMEILRHGPHVKVVEPPDLKKEVHRQLVESLRLYQDSP